MARVLAAITAFLLLLPAPGRAQVVGEGLLTDADREAIHKVIILQIEALQHDDGELAFSYASPWVQDRFGTPEEFLEMVKTAYPPVYRPRDLQFRELKATYDGPVQKVLFIGPDSEPVLGLYYMQKQSDGSWKVNGCLLAPTSEVGI